MLLPLVALLASPADACGGLFCNSSAPTMQAAERIVFAIDTEQQEVEVHVGITYSGESQDFSWVVPVPADPEIFLSTDQLWPALYFPTNPSYTMAVKIKGECQQDRTQEDALAAVYDAPNVSYSSTADSGGVQVLAHGAVGPYETVTLAADNSQALTDWLTASGYDIPADLGPKLDPYVALGQDFVALRLLPGRTTGDIAPIGLRYSGTQGSVPIQLTSIAALPDTRLEVYVLGDATAVPLSYLHVIPNDMAYDWFGQTVQYDDIVTMAADEAGGHAFATDFSGSTGFLRGSLFSEGTYDLDAMRVMNLDAWLAVAYMPSFYSAYGYGYYYSAATLDANLSAVMEQVLPEPVTLVAQGVPEAQWWSCPECYPEGSAISFDPAFATDTFEEGYIEPLRNAEGLFSRFDHITRLTSSLDAEEMTVDPTFGFNADMPQDVSNLHNATLTYDCESRHVTQSEAYRALQYPDGTVVNLPSEEWFSQNGTTEYEYLSRLAAINAAIVEQTGEIGMPVVVSDNTGVLQGIIDDMNASFAKEFGGCGGCNGTGVPMGPGLIGLAALFARRRR